MHRRELLKKATALGAALPFLSPATLMAQSEDEAILATVNPELRDFARHILPYFRNAPPLSRATLGQQRANMKSYARKPLADVPYEKRTIAGAKGQPDVTIYVINAKAEGHRPAILYTHGGGFVAGEAEAGVFNLQEICKKFDCAAVSVEYRLAPETTYAGSIEDNYAALKWLHGNAAKLGVDPARLAVMGESAGGGHAALLAITARDRGEVPLVFQCLIYPMLDDRTGTSRSVPPHVGKLIWTPESNRFGWESFLGTQPGGLTAPKGAVPARVENLVGLPPAFIGVGSIDLFCDEDIEYARRLNAAGVPAELIAVPGAFHGFDSLPVQAKVSQQFNAAKLDALRRGLGIA
jgi:acetyl esterase/lipase